MQIDSNKCAGCGGCVNLCPQAAIYFVNNKAVIDQLACTECRTCVFVCGMAAPAVSCRFPQFIVLTGHTGHPGPRRGS